ncbi:hypothetical protein NLI96_g4920 [Meripilus lineatus]|uniref:Haloacid dehalogenase n=1 Tax=Meripilus lineatus TaxID=2056292 RepID=A0AAD5V3Y9_9APHY|nr:hypothetical protein NLI96_g4920 [Physisporinus lineatus]
MADEHPLQGVEALLFDVFGTVVDWRGSVTKEMGLLNPDLPNEDWDQFAGEWREGYYTRTAQIAQGTGGPTNVDVLHREILDSLLEETRWKHLAEKWNEEKRQEVTLVWHRLGGWPDTTKGLYELKKQAIIATLSNGNARLLVDMAKFADLPWDIVFSGDILGSYKPNPKMYLGAAERLSLPPEKCAMVAAHLRDLRAAASFGLKTIFVRRPTEETAETRSQAKDKKGGGEVDVVVDSFNELVEILNRR